MIEIDIYLSISASIYPSIIGILSRYYSLGIAGERRALSPLNTSNAMLQRGAHALLFLMCSPLLVRCEDVRLASEPTHPRAIAHAQVH